MSLGSPSNTRLPSADSAIEGADFPRVPFPASALSCVHSPLLRVNTEAALTLRKRDCEKREADQKARIAWIEDETGAKSAIWVIEKSGARKISLGVSECDGQRAEAGGQSGDNERLSRVARGDSQSVEELADEGQAFESEVVSGVEDADDSEAEVTTHEVPEDDVPSEYDGDR